MPKTASIISQRRIASAVLVAALAAAAIVAVLRSQGAETARHGPEDLTDLNRVRMDVRSTPDSLDRVANAAGQAGLDQLRQIEAQLGIPASDFDPLAEDVASRVAAILDPSPERWATAASVHLSQQQIQRFLSEQDIDWSALQEVWGRAAVSLEDVQARALQLNDQRSFTSQIGQSMTRSPHRGPYRNDSNDLVVEVVVPMSMKEIDQPKRRPVYIGLSYEWSSDQRRWLFRNTTVYSDRGNVLAPPQ